MAAANRTAQETAVLRHDFSGFRDASFRSALKQTSQGFRAVVWRIHGTLTRIINVAFRYCKLWHVLWH